MFGEWSLGFFTNEGRVLMFDADAPVDGSSNGNGNSNGKGRGQVNSTINSGQTRPLQELFFANQNPIGLSMQGLGEDEDGEIYILGNATGTPFGGTGTVLEIVP